MIEVNKTKTMIVSRSRTEHLHTVVPIYSQWNCSEGVAIFDVVGVTFDAKMTFTKHLNSV